MGQLSDPFKDDAADNLGISISGLPDEPEEPDDVELSGPDEPEGDFDSEAVELAAGDRVAVEGTGLDSTILDADGNDLDDDDDEIDAGNGPDELDDMDEDENDDVGEEVAYDLTDWDDDQLSTLFDKLTEAGIDYLWDGEELFVREVDEDGVDAVIDKVTYPDQLAEDSDQGDAGGTMLGDIYIAADRLQHDPEEHEAVAALLVVADAAEDAKPPYGLTDEEWKHLRDKVDVLAQLLEVETIDIDAATEAAQDLRNAIRPYV